MNRRSDGSLKRSDSIYSRCAEVRVMPRWISIVILLAVIAITGAVMYRVMSSFLLPLFLASVLTVIFRPVHRWIQSRCRGRNTLAALLTTMLVLLAVLAPICTVVVLAVREGLGAVGGDVLDRGQNRLEAFRKQMELEIPFELPIKEGTEPIRLSQLDEEMRALPDQMPDLEKPLDVVLRERLEFLQTGMTLLRKRLEESRQLAARTPVSDAESLELKRIRRLIAANPEEPFEALEDVLSTLKHLHTATTLLEADASSEVSAGSDRLPPASEKSEEVRLSTTELRRQYARMKAQYEVFRIDMLGGAVRAWLTDLVNPGMAQIDSARANLQRYLRSWLPSVAGQATAMAGHLVLGLGIMTLGLFYFLKDGPAMVRTLMRLSPLEDRYERELLTEYDSVSRAVVLATLLSAVAQAILAGIAYYVAGFESIFLLTSLTFLLAMVPFVGAAAVWLPACLWLAFVDERYVAASVLAVYGVIVISMVDNIVKPLVLHGQSHLHPLLALLSVLGGVQALGPIGILVGPMIVSFLQALLNILHNELNTIGPAPMGTVTVEARVPPQSQLPA